MKYAIRYVPRNKRKSEYLKLAGGKKRVFRTKKGAERIKNIYDYKKNIKIVKLK